MPVLLKGLIFGPNGRPMSPSHTRQHGRIYRFYVMRLQQRGGRKRIVAPGGRELAPNSKP
jgi:hypothetical protein